MLAPTREAGWFNDGVNEGPVTGTWVADAGSATAAARAYLRHTLRSARWWWWVVLVEIAGTALFATSFDDRFGWVARLVWGAVYAALLTVCVMALVVAVAYLLTRRRFRYSLREGVVLEGEVDDGFVMLRGPRSEHRLSFDGLTSVRREGSWVFLRQRGARVVSVWPAEVFGPGGVSRLSRSVDGRSDART